MKMPYDDPSLKEFSGFREARSWGVARDFKPIKALKDAGWLRCIGSDKGGCWEVK